MQRKLPLSRPVHMGETIRSASTSALNAPSPRDGEVRHTKLPDTFDGIRFEIGRMIKYVQDSADDPVVVGNAHRICHEYADRMGIGEASEVDGKKLCTEAIEAWCREHYVYLNDPPNIEFIQTPRRMVKQTRVPPEVIRFAIEPLCDAMKATADAAEVDAYEPPPITWGDCDEGSDFALGHAAAVGIRPLGFDFGGHDGTLHHVWANMGGVAADLTEPGYRLGDFSSFEHYESVEVPL